MDKRSTANTFILVAALFYSVRYITIALLCGNDPALVMRFHEMLERIGSPLLRLSIISFVIGMVYLFLVESSKLNKRP